MRAAGASVEAKLRRIDDAEVAAELASARCVLLPYVGHYGSSGVLAEAAAAGTPVLSTGDGLLGHLVREYGLGLTVDPTDSPALREGMLQLIRTEDRGRFLPGMGRYLEAHSPAAFAAAARAGAGLD
jgi:glycosyltransferase involved in cell wall biosynthesis